MKFAFYRSIRALKRLFGNADIYRNENNLCQ